jgi:hypothetical protein
MLIKNFLNIINLVLKKMFGKLKVHYIMGLLYQG